MKTKSSKKMSDQVLGVMPSRRVEALLLDWANIETNPKDVEAVYRRLIRRYPEVFPPQFQEKIHFDIVRLFGKLLRMAWDAPTLRKREWYLHDAESFYHTATNHFGDPPTEATPLEATLYYFRRNSERALHCPNPDCVAPYFFATKKGQKYCSEVCALPAQQESKRRWWHENKGKTNQQTKGRRA